MFVKIFRPEFGTQFSDISVFTSVEQMLRNTGLEQNQELIRVWEKNNFRHECVQYDATGKISAMVKKVNLEY